ncbi:MAG: hypothetical protein JW751_23055 [Polyangiaceae bacterium]|nr:hypothetical protein [Polyangiaceae bacterium]
MSRSCEICANHRAYGLSEQPRVPLQPRRIRMILIENRIFSLCEHHIKELVDAGASTIAAVQSLFAETAGMRSLVTRRAPLNRRVFPPRPEGRRATKGRRASDQRT